MSDKGEFAHGKVDPVEAGRKGGQSTGGSSDNTTSSSGGTQEDTYKPTEHDGLRKDGQPDGRVGTGEFAHGKVDPHEAGKQGGSTS